MKSLSKNLGFTLVELLVAIAIVGILATISVSLFDEYRRKANDAVAISQVHDALTAHAGFKVDNENQICDFTINSDHTVTYGGGSRTMEDCFPGFVHANDVVLSFQQYNNGSGGFDDSGYHAAALHCFGSYDDSGPSHFVVLDQVRDGAYRTPDLTRVSMDFLSNIPHYAAGLQHRCYAGDGFGSGGGGGSGGDTSGGDTGGGSATPTPSGGGDTGGGDSGSDTADVCGCGSDPEHYGYVISEGQCCSIGMKTGCSEEGSPCLGCGVEMSQCTGGGDTGSDTGTDTGSDTGSDTVGGDSVGGGGDSGGGADSYGMDSDVCCYCEDNEIPDDSQITVHGIGDCASICATVGATEGAGNC